MTHPDVVTAATTYIDGVTHPIDRAAGVLLRLGGRRSTVFPEGWGDRVTVEMLSDPEAIEGPVEAADIVWGRKAEHVGHRSIRGRFTSPIASRLPDEISSVPVERIEPAVGAERTVILLPAWNDHGFDQRRMLAMQLLEHGVASLITEIPLYGVRRTAPDSVQAIRTVADFALMGLGAVLETRALLATLPRDRPAGVAGFSMGGNLAAITAAVEPRPIAVAALAASHSPGPVYLDGVLRHAIDWDALGGRSQHESLRRVLSAASAITYPPADHHRAAVVVAAQRDGFVPMTATRALAEHWGADFRVIPGGHATALWRHRPTFAGAIGDAFDRFEESSAA